MKTLIIKNIPSEGPGTIIEFLNLRGLPYRIVEASLEPIPDIDEYDVLIVMGGPMAVYEMDRYPFLRDVAWVIEKAIKKNKRVLGICLGAQLIAHVLGAKVYKGKEEEIGWLDIEPTLEGARDAVLRMVVEGSGTTKVLQWHGDTFDLPEGSIRLAFSQLYLNQAFRYDNCYALQFHIEVTPEMIREWFSDREDLPYIMEETKRLYPRYRLRADQFYTAFFNLHNKDTRG
jgi:GMP synthase-like glutamine amidotransferase